MSREIANLFASKFIARPDVKAVQFSNGAWAPHQEYNPQTGKRDGARIPWRREDLESHIRGSNTYGHYLLSGQSECKLFAFDVDLNKAGFLPVADWFSEHYAESPPDLVEVSDLRAAWLDRAHVGRSYMKLQFKEMAHKLLAGCVKMKLQCAAAYSGGKGVHVYGFLPKPLTADKAREGAEILLETVGGFKAVKGDVFFEHEDYPNLGIELFPKQNNLEGKDLGNLMRLPLGKNLKAPQEPTFFIDMNAPMAQLSPLDPIQALTMETPWS